MKSLADWGTLCDETGLDEFSLGCTHPSLLPWEPSCTRCDGRYLINMLDPASESDDQGIHGIRVRSGSVLKKGEP